MNGNPSFTVRQPVSNTTRRLIPLLVAAALCGASLQTYAQAPSADPQIEALQQQMNLLRERLALVRMQSEFDTAKAQSEFARLAGIKAGLNGIGAPPGKDGTLTLQAGEESALLLKLKAPMITGLETAANRIADAIVAERGRLGGGIAIASETDVQDALQAAATHSAIKEVVNALHDELKAIEGRGIGVASVAAAVGGASLLLQTINDFSRFFRTDRTMTVHSADTEAGQILQLLLENRLASENGLLVNLTEFVPGKVIEMAKEVRDELAQLKDFHARGAMALGTVDAMPENERSGGEDRLRAAVAKAKELYEALDPEQKAEAFWSYVGGRYKNKRLRDVEGEKFLGRLMFHAKAQTVQVVESRTFRSDKIFGTGGVQVDYRIVDGDGALVKSELWLLTIDSDGASNSARAWPASPTRIAPETAALAVNE